MCHGYYGIASKMHLFLRRSNISSNCDSTTQRVGGLLPDDFHFWSFMFWKCASASNRAKLMLFMLLL